MERIPLSKCLKYTFLTFSSNETTYLSYGTLDYTEPIPHLYTSLMEQVTYSYVLKYIWGQSWKFHKLQYNFWVLSSLYVNILNRL